MLAPNPIPTLDPNPLPAPYWLCKLLLVATFFLHILAMNLLLGGGVVALAARWWSRRPDFGNRLLFDVARKAPSLLAATITLGIAPLLFVQVVYGQFFYTSTILLAWPWFLVLVYVTLAYYGFYYVAMRGEKRPGRAVKVFLLSVLLIVAVGFTLSNNLTLSQTPSRWAAKYFGDPRGWNLNLSEPTLLPRFLHFFTAAVAVGGLLLVLVAWAKWRRDPEYAREVFQFGGKAFILATMAQFLLGIGFVAGLPADLRMLFFGGNTVATLLLIAGVAGALGAIYVMSEALRTENVRLAGRYATGLTAAVILAMSVMRDLLRDAYLNRDFHPQEFVVKTQWSVLPLFLALFVAGAILWFVMLKRYGLFSRRRAAD